MLNSKEDKVLLTLILSAIIMVFVTIYLVSNKTYKEEGYIQNNNIHIINTGVTFESTFQDVFDKNTDKFGEYDIDSYSPTINSNNISTDVWNRIAKDIGSVYHKYDAFIVLHGKENLSYSASILSFMLENLDKPVILAHENVASVIMKASTTNISEVMVYDNGRLLRAARTIETKHGFSSPNYQPLTEHNSLQKPTEKPQIMFINPKKYIVVVKLFPTIKSENLIHLIEQTKDSNVSGVVLETYDNGNAPTNKLFLKTIKKLVDNGIVIVSVSQNNQNVGVNKKLKAVGVLSGGDMTTPAAFAKLNFLLSNVKDMKVMDQLMDQSFRGEMTTKVET